VSTPTIGEQLATVSMMLRVQEAHDALQEALQAPVPGAAYWRRVSRAQRRLADLYGELAQGYQAASGRSALAAQAVPR
jgi:hypothetical protein